MRLGFLLSGGKDSLYAAYIAKQEHELVCAITINTENKESYMFHTPNIVLTQLQSEAMKLPHVMVTSQGNKEEELEDLYKAIKNAKEQYRIEGLVTGAVGSVYQASRIQKICLELGLWCFNPLWQKDQLELLRELLEHEFEVIISGVFAYPLTKDYLGKRLDEAMISNLAQYQEQYQLNPAGEGGEIETFVVDCPLFHKRINILSAAAQFDNHAGVYHIEEALLAPRQTLEVRHKDPHKLFCEEADILLIDTTSDPLHYYEFVLPIERILKEEEKSYCLLKFEQLHLISPNKYSKAIITGTALIDNNFLEHRESIECLKRLEQPILGICAGAQLLAWSNGAKLTNNLTIGMRQLEPQARSTITENMTQGYFLHQHGINVENTNLVTLLETDAGKVAAFQVDEKLQYGILFHPEARNKDAIRAFVNGFVL